MTRIAFHFNIAEPLSYLERLLRKAHRAGAQVVVLAEPSLTRALDLRLWEGVSAAEFLPHCLAASASPVCQAASAVVLFDDPAALAAAAFTGDAVLVNLLHPVPAPFAKFSRLLEMVSTIEADREAARERWRLYKSQGYELTRHDSRPEARPA